MSGFAAHLGRDGPGDAVAVRRALAAVSHRGTPREVAVIGSCALGIVRHDEGDAASLATTDQFGAAVAGRIDNASDVERALRDRGRALPDTSPAGLILAGFSELGEDLLPMLRGTHAVAVTDGRRLWVARDHLGSGPAFYRDDGRAVWAGSEAKQVVAAAGIAKDPDLDLLEAIFYGLREDHMPTVLKGVNRLPKASVLEADQEGSRTRRYWDPSGLVETGRIPRSELRPAFEALMTRAADRVFRGDDILALSGGIDSPALAAYAADSYRSRFGRPLRAMTMVFPDYPSADESRYVHEVVERLGLELHAYQPPSGAQTLEHLDSWTDLTDGPWMGWWEPGMDVDRYTRLKALGVGNYVTGDFAEFDMALPYHLVSHLLWKGRLGPLLHQLQAQYRSGIRRSKLARQLASAFLPGRFFRWYRGVRRVWPVPEWVDPRRLTPTTPAERLPPWERWRHHQLAGFLGPGLPFEAYHIFNESQRVSVRWPWADVDLWEFFVALPAEVKFPGAQSKQLVREFIRGRVPDSIVDRKVNTVIDEFVQRSFDYASLRRWIGTGDFRMPGIDYAKLHARLDRGALANWEYESIKDLAQVHAFLSLWDGARRETREAPTPGAGGIDG